MNTPFTVNEIIFPKESYEKIKDLIHKIGIVVFNTLSRSKEQLKTLQENKLLLYTCGPTVYNYAHIGNLRSYVFPDLLKRIVRYSGYDVKQIINFTDVGHLTDDGDHGEDKMQNAVKKEKKSSWDIAAFYEESFKKDFLKLQLTYPTEFVKATSMIAEQIELIKGLEKKGYVYVIEGDGLYMDTSKVKDYGKLLGFHYQKHLQGIQAGERIEDVGKRNPTDFALWKFNITDKKRDMEWDSPWGVGFPGWHIECSAMAINKLGETIDIHTGGIDHIPIHHTNEIAQSESYTGKPFSNYRMHGEFLHLDEDTKMSKSSGNFLSLAKVEELGYDPLAFKYLTYLTHYRKGMKFSIEILEQASQGYHNLKKQIRKKIESNIIVNSTEKTDQYYTKIFSSLLDDLNMPSALSEFWKMVKDPEISSVDTKFLVEEFDKIAGLNLLVEDLEEETLSDIPQDIQKLLQDREMAKKNKDWGKADSIREQIKLLGYTIQDTKDGPTVFKV